MATAILVDGGFYRKRAAAIWGQKTAKERADELMEHIDGLSSHWRDMKSGKRHVGANSQRPAP